MYSKHQRGMLSEALLIEYLLTLGYFVYTPMWHIGPVDIIAINESTGDIVLLDAKTEGSRVIKDRKGPQRINRSLSSNQKQLGVRIAYVNLKTSSINIIPPLNEGPVKTRGWGPASPKTPP
jgi:hypothetical protein